MDFTRLAAYYLIDNYIVLDVSLTFFLSCTVLHPRHVTRADSYCVLHVFIVMNWVFDRVACV